MAHISNQQLNDLLITLSRGLLQYAGESCLWVREGADDERAAFEKLVADQQHSLARLADFLMSRGHFIDPGSFPTEYTSLHYVALDYLLDQMIASHADGVRHAKALADAADAEDPAGELIRTIAADAQGHLEELERLAAARQAA